MKEQSHKDEMRAALRGDFERLRARRQREAWPRAHVDGPPPMPVPPASAHERAAEPQSEPSPEPAATSESNPAPQREPSPASEASPAPDKPASEAPESDVPEPEPPVETPRRSRLRALFGGR